MWFRRLPAFERGVEMPRGFPDDGHRLTDDARAAFLRVLRESCNVSAAAREVGFARRSLYTLRERDEEFAAQWDEAVEEATDTLEREARRRAVEGTDRPIYQRGELVGYEKQYSDTLMCLLLKAHRPQKFSEKHAVELTGASGGPVQVEHSEEVDDRIRKLLNRGREESSGESLNGGSARSH